jgi:hypothetical protein
MNSIKDGEKAVMSYFMVLGIHQDAERKTKKRFSKDRIESWTSRSMRNSNESRTTVGSKEWEDGPESPTNLCVYGLNF